MKRLFVRILGGCLVACLLGVSTLRAADDDPRQVIETISQRLQQVLEQNRERLKNDTAFLYRLADEIFLPHVDMSRVSSLVLGRSWRKATPAQKDAFILEFKHLLIRTYATAIRELGDWEIRMQAQRPRTVKGRALVQTHVLRPGAQPLAVDYQMHRSKGRWLAYDVKIESISLVTNYRSSFKRLIRQKGIDGLIEELAALNDAKESGQSSRVAASTEYRQEQISPIPD